MLETAVITFREGMEAFLIVAICMAYLKCTQRSYLFKPMYAGIAVALVSSAVLGIWLETISGNPATEGSLAMIAGFLVATLTIHMIKASKTISKTITNTLERNAQKAGIWAGFGIFAFVALMITREGMETALMMNGIMYETEPASMMAGAILGILMAAGAAFMWVKKSHLIQLGRFLQVTSIFLLLFALHLFMYGFHELTEAMAVPYIDNAYWHMLTEPLEANEIGGEIIGLCLVFVPLSWLAFVTIKDKLAQRKFAMQQAAAE